jgi:hypothetical protein
VTVSHNITDANSAFAAYIQKYTLSDKKHSFAKISEIENIS